MSWVTHQKKVNYSRDPSGRLPKADEAGRIVLYDSTSAIECLTLDPDGISYRNLDTSLGMKWAEIIEINTEAIALPVYTMANDLYFQTRVKLVGREVTIFLNPVFSVAPREIIKYILEKCEIYGNNLDKKLYDKTPGPMKFISELTPAKRLLLFFIIMISLIIFRAFFPHSSFWSS
jgi:hypothetical protein